MVGRIIMSFVNLLEAHHDALTSRTPGFPSSSSYLFFALNNLAFLIAQDFLRGIQ